jgi:hypothetical protein
MPSPRFHPVALAHGPFGIDPSHQLNARRGRGRTRRFRRGPAARVILSLGPQGVSRTAG